jgi:hypothetical protein
MVFNESIGTLENNVLHTRKRKIQKEKQNVLEKREKGKCITKEEKWGKKQL